MMMMKQLQFKHSNSKGEKKKWSRKGLKKELKSQQFNSDRKNGNVKKTRLDKKNCNQP